MRRVFVLALTLVFPVAALGAVQAESSPAEAAVTGTLVAAPATVGGDEAEPFDDETESFSALTARRTIRGEVGPGFTISVNKHRVSAGTYRFRISDRSDMHDFRIIGPGGVDRATSVPGTGVTIWRLKLRKGTYTIVCSPHAQFMRTTLEVV